MKFIVQVGFQYLNCEGKTDTNMANAKIFNTENEALIFLRLVECRLRSYTAKILTVSFVIDNEIIIKKQDSLMSGLSKAM